ncbi:unannotated protein [freshwater metagenome]|uniref:Unannotated protein n=1 Tax=freshwater metagenome TaxID=449393 RepID=A0A6J7HYN1_9ZZZZ|nr:hypothetical protein [Actinomycetota bacterium]
MARSLRRRAAQDDGIAMFTVVMVMAVLLVLGAALATSSLQSSTTVNGDELGVRALQAAEAGAQTAVHRLNMLQPSSSNCITTVSSAPQTQSIWCAATAAESIGNGQSFTYQTSVPSTSGCTGKTFGIGTSERCVVATGTVGGVTKKVIQRIVSSSGADPFPTDGILGRDSLTVDNNTTINAGLASNGLLSFGLNSPMTGTVTLWTGAPNPTGYSGTVTRQSTAFVLSPPDMLNPLTLVDSSTSNSNGQLVTGASPADSCTLGTGTGGTCYVNTSFTPRTLSVGNYGAVTLGGAVYNFCQLSLGNNAAVNIASGARTTIFIDSPDRAGSGCIAGQGGITSGNGAFFSNPSGDPRGLVVVIYGATASPTKSGFTTIQFPNNISLAAAIYSPGAGITFKNNGSFSGGITAKNVTLKNNASWDSRLEGFTLATTLIYYRGSWRQCNPLAATTSTTPAAGCPLDS